MKRVLTARILKMLTPIIISALLLLLPAVNSIADDITLNSGSIEFICHSMPIDGMRLARRQAFSVEGIIRTRSPLKSVQIVVNNSSGNAELKASVTSFENPYEYYLDGEKNAINGKLKFGALQYGEKRISLTVSTQARSDVVLYEADFSVERWAKLEELHVHGVGLQAMYDLYDGSDDFLFTFKVRSSGDRWISISSEWKKQNLTVVRGVGRSYLVNVHAQAAFTNAFNHIKNSNVYIEYNNGSSGVFPLSKLVGSSINDGTYAPRFTGDSMSHISHHAFGTAIDINSDLRCNQIRVRKGVDNSWLSIYAGISKLSFDGIRTVNGIDNVYCFKYDGDRSGGYAPENIRNYLLFEIAFYREGFSWGAYFMNKCDAMHFTLTEPNDYDVVYPEDSDSKNDRKPIHIVTEYAPIAGALSYVQLGNLKGFGARPPTE